jgi:RNA polymerase sigma-70 factor (ECF subfamily)
VQGEGESGQGRPVVYCLVPRELAPSAHDLLRRHCRDDPSVEVIVERRGAERRDARDRREARAETASGAERSARERPDAPMGDAERRRIRNLRGRRVGERRAAVVSVSAPPLPRRARAFAEQLTFVERLEPSTQEAEDLDTARVVTRIQGGDQDAFSVLYMRYFDRIYGYHRAILRAAAEADDATQEVFLKAFEGLPGYEWRSGTFRGWLFTIARNHAMDLLHQRGRLESLDAEEVKGRDVASEPGELRPLDWISDRELHLFIERLPLPQRQVLFLRYVVGLRSAEIATILGQSPEAVRQHQTRAMRFLRTRLSALGREPKRGDRAGARVLIRRARVVRARRYALIAPGPAR